MRGVICFDERGARPVTRAPILIGTSDSRAAPTDWALDRQSRA